MPRFKGLKFSSLIVILFFALPALAQFEVSPDHFDPANTKAPATAHKANVNRPSASAHRRSSGTKPDTTAKARRKAKPKRQVAAIGTWPHSRD